MVGTASADAGLAGDGRIDLLVSSLVIGSGADEEVQSEVCLDSLFLESQERHDAKDADEELAVSDRADDE
jgi:hypothetical protein